MKDYQNSDYALNKHSDGIVYRFADRIVEVTLTDYLAENPDKTEDDFIALKSFSDADYREQDRHDYRQTWKNTSLDTIAETMLCSSPSAESAVIDAQEEAERKRNRAALGKKAWNKLTEVQKRRYFMYHVNGFSTWKIAEAEGVNQSKIVKSLSAADRKIKKALSE